MGAKGVIVFPLGKPAKLLKWAVEEGSFVSIGRVLLFYNLNVDAEKPTEQKLKAKTVGVIRKLLVKEGEIIEPGKEILELDGCTHPTVMNSMCAECGVDLKEDDQVESNASVPVIHSIPDLKVSREQAEILGKADEERLLKERRLVLLVDLDQTLIHTTNDNIPPNIKDIYHFQLYGSVSPWYHTRIRPGTQKFLSEITQYYELHICTFGARNYAHTIATFLDPDGKYFSHRILSRDECFSSNTKTANLKALFPCGDNLVCIIDDREDVWNFAPNLIHVKPYHFFQHTGDINAPPGLAKCENDDKSGHDFKKSGAKPATEMESDSKGNGSASESNKLVEGEENNLNKPCVVADSKEEKDGFQNTLPGKESIQNHINKKSSPAVNNSQMECTEAAASEITTGKSSLGNETECELANRLSSKSDLQEKAEKKPDQKKENDQKKNKNLSRVDKQLKKEEKNIRSAAEGENKQPNAEPLKKEEEAAEKSGVSDKEEEKPDSTAGANGDDELTEVEDDDDYLIYLEEILKTIHRSFYELYDESPGEMPDLKNVIPYVRRKVLAGTYLVFSGLVPTHVPLERSRAYQVAVQLGAVVTPDLTDYTTHLVAVRPGTAKVNAVQRRHDNILLVTPDWLWACAERWEHVEERLFPLGRGTSARRHPPAHCASPTRVPPSYVLTPDDSSGQQKSTSGDSVLEIINPLMSFSSEDIASMDREVEDIFNESESEIDSEGESKADTDEDDKNDDSILGGSPPKIRHEDDSSSSSSGSLTAESPHGWKHHEEFKREKRRAKEAFEDDEDLLEDSPCAKFRRGEKVPSDLDVDSPEDEESASNDGSDEPPDEVDDGEWNMMGAALEREFLSGSD
ncbi:RNA polymerase II subunit A C-terminal domain phosphatase [Schistocerca serialis cubense]|uniref:RNA polymerase II subunit A C-terminal domain phosphatase n=1 Tax=Schistocerca serialis cubense TaxID=2023355 RepID=UPI00214E99CC|nr:RNA polymerase II subunit A C-terminal domain phosphatase [Schistocerca serialis cubense]